MQKPQKNEIELTPSEIERFARHLTLAEIGIEGQKQLKGSSVLCIGAGGLGSPLLLYLAAAGVGRIGIVDFDLVDESNLQRQVIHSTKWIGKSKADSAKERLLEINPTCKVELYKEVLCNENALEIISPYDLVCDCTDNFPSRYLINDACVLLKKPYIYGSIQQFEGQVSVFNLDEHSPNYRDLVPIPPPPYLVPSCEEGGVVGVLPGLIGTMQATEVIKIITGIGTTLSGRILIFNALSMNFKELKLTKDPDTPQIEKLINYKEFCNHIKSSKASGEEPSIPSIPSISVKEIRGLIKNSPEKIIVVDVRTKMETDAYKLPNSKLIPLKDIESREATEYLKKVTSTRKLFILCQKGSRSKKALLILKKQGINGTNILGGLDAWLKESNLDNEI